MKRKIAAAIYWLAAITITLGAYGHGFVGVKPVRADAPRVLRHAPPCLNRIAPRRSENMADRKRWLVLDSNKESDPCGGS